MSESLTTHLLRHTPTAFRAATQHPFLHRAGTSSLPRPLLLSWLTQDRLYALSYIPFIGSLLSKTTPPATPSRVHTLEWRLTTLLIDALANIRRELAMFEHILATEFGDRAEEEASAAYYDGRGEQQRPRTETRAYMDLFAGAAAPNASLLTGLVALWATEKCYLEAWRFAKAQGGQSHGHGHSNESKSSEGKGKGTSDVLTQTLIPNWTSDEFVEFVDTIGDLVDELGAEVSPESRQWEKCEEVWRQVLWAEEHFWPEVEA